MSRGEYLKACDEISDPRYKFLLVTTINKIHDELEVKIKEAFLAGWNESGEGWNAEWGVNKGQADTMANNYLEKLEEKDES